MSDNPHEWGNASPPCCIDLDYDDTGDPPVWRCRVCHSAYDEGHPLIVHLMAVGFL